MTDDPGELLYAGEERLDEVAVDDARLVLTSHRLLIRRERGRRLETIDRANVLGVGTRTLGRTARLSLGAQLLGLGAVLAALARFVEFDGLAPTVEDPGTVAGMGGLFAVAAALFDLLLVLDDALLVGGLLAGLAGAGLVLWWLLTRETVVVVRVAGGDPVFLPSSGPKAAAERVRALLRRRVQPR